MFRLFFIIIFLYSCSQNQEQVKNNAISEVLELEQILIDSDILNNQEYQNLDFGSVFFGQTTTQQLIIANNSLATISLLESDFDLSEKGSFQVENKCIGIIAARKKCIINISLNNPESLTADIVENGTIKIKNLTLTFTSVLMNNISNIDSEIVVSPMHLNFGLQEIEKSKNIRLIVKNNGTSNRPFAISGFTNPSISLINNCPTELKSRQICSILISSQSSNINIDTNELLGQIFTKSISFSREVFQYNSTNPQLLNIISSGSENISIQTLDDTVTGNVTFKNNDSRSFVAGGTIESDIEGLVVNSNNCTQELMRGKTCSVYYTIPANTPSNEYIIKLKNSYQVSKNHILEVVSNVPQCAENQILKNGNCVYFLTNAFVGQNTICSQMSSGVVKCSGANSSNLLGIGPTTNILSPIEIVALNGAKKISISSSHSCALFHDNSVKCAGANSSGQLGLGDTIQRTTYTNVPAFNGAIDIEASGNGTCALFSDYTIKCAGSNTDGGFGIGSNNAIESTPVIAFSLNGAKEMFFTGGVLCAILTDDTLKCSGRNNIGQLGTGGTTSINLATTIFGFENNVGYVRGSAHACALMTDESVRCAGYNGNGAMGFGSTGSQYLTAVLNPNFVNVKKLFAFNDRTCAQLQDNTFMCSGNNGAGALGLGHFTHPITTPQEAAGFYNMKKYILGTNNICAITNEDELKCSGYNFFGQLGLGNNSNVNVPTLLPLFY